MTSKLLESFVNTKVHVSTVDGKILEGVLQGIDLQCNLILSKCIERLFSTEIGVETQEHGLFLVRGDNIATIGDIDEEVDSLVEWSKVFAEPLKQIRW